MGQVSRGERVLSVKLGCQCQLCQVSTPLRQVSRGALVPEKVDTIVSEVLGNCLFAERGMETMLVARDRFLKPGGKTCWLFYSKGFINCSPP